MKTLLPSIRLQGLLCCLMLCVVPELVFGGSKIGKPVFTANTIQKMLAEELPEFEIQSDVASFDSAALPSLEKQLNHVNSSLFAMVNPGGVDVVWNLDVLSEVVTCRIEKWDGEDWELLGVVQRHAHEHNESMLFHDATASNGSNIYRVCIATVAGNPIASNPTLAVLKAYRSPLECAVNVAHATGSSAVRVSSAYHTSENAVAFVFSKDGKFKRTIDMAFDAAGVSSIVLENGFVSGDYVCIQHPNIIEAVRL